MRYREPVSGFIFDFVASKIYDERDDFDLNIVQFLFLDGDIPRASSYGVYTSQLMSVARVSSHVADFNCNSELSQTRLSVSQTL